MKPVTQELLRQAAAAFDFGLPTGEAERYGAGHINDTFAVWAADHSRRWILQRINTDTFTDPAGLMENVTGVTSYLRREILARGGDPDRETLNVVPTREGKPYYTDCEGGAWRAYRRDLRQLPEPAGRLPRRHPARDHRPFPRHPQPLRQL